MEFITVNDLTFHARFRDGPGPTLVFSNSLGTDFRIWNGVIAALPGEYRLLCYDTRGHGLSEMGPPGAEIADHAADLAALMSAYDIADAVICGLSVGGLVAQALAAAHPDRVSGLILSNTGSKIGTEQIWAARIEAVHKNGIASVADQVMAMWFSARYRADHPAPLAGWRAMLSRTPIAGYTALCGAISRADFRATAPGISVPTLCIGGTEDGSTPPSMLRELAGAIPDARAEIIDGVGHIPCVEAPGDIARLIAGHMRACGA